MKIDLTGKTAVIFGASRGIGEGIATVLASCGAKVYVSSRSESGCYSMKEQLRVKGYQAEACVANVSSYEDVDNVLKTAIADTGRLDIVINNAGIVCLSSFLDATQEEIHDLININLMGANNGCQAAIKHMIELGISGKIVNTSSFAGRHALQAGFSHYGMTKAGVIYITQAAAYAGAPYNINVNAVCPGIIRSKMWETILDSYVDSGRDREESWKESLKTFIPLARGDQKAEDIAYTVAFLCSEYADHITGQSINVDGGAAMN